MYCHIPRRRPLELWRRPLLLLRDKELAGAVHDETGDSDLFFL